MRKLCTVVVPVYNGAGYLQKTIESILSQDYLNKEIIFVDDASSDNSIQILQTYYIKHPEMITIIKHRENRGLVQSMLSGIQASNGEYISSFGQDDVMLKNRLSTLIFALQKYRVSMVCSNAYYMYGNEPTQYLVRPRWTSDRVVKKHSFLVRNPVIGPTAIFRKYDFSKIDPSLFKFRNSMEWIHWFQYALLDGIYYVGSPLIYYRRHTNNLSSSLFTSDEYQQYTEFCKTNIALKLGLWEKVAASMDRILQKMEHLIDTRKHQPLTKEKKHNIRHRYQMVQGASKLNIYLYNRGQSGNIGDYLINDVISTLLQQDSSFTIVNNALYPDIKNKFDLITAHIKSYLNDIINIIKSDIVVIGGGNLIMDVSSLGINWAIHHFWLSILCKVLQKRYFYLCVGATPLTKPMSRMLYRYSLKNAERVSVRDSFSRDFLANLTGRNDIRLVFDPVLLISKVYRIQLLHMKDKPVIGICPVQLYPTICRNAEMYHNYVDLHTKLIKTFIEYGARVYLFLNDSQYDQKVFDSIVYKVTFEHQRLHTIAKFQNIDEYLTFIGNLDFIISSRMHAAICATSYGIPSIGLGWQPKMKYFYQDLGLRGHINILDRLNGEKTTNDLFQAIIQLYNKQKDNKPVEFNGNINIQELLNLRI